MCVVSSSHRSGRLRGRDLACVKAELDRRDTFTYVGGMRCGSAWFCRASADHTHCLSSNLPQFGAARARTGADGDAVHGR